MHDRRVKNNGQMNSTSSGRSPRAHWLLSLRVRIGLVLSALVFFKHPVFAAGAPTPENREGISVSHLTNISNDVTNGLGSWIWADKTYDRQTCRLWRRFDIPHGVKVTSARMKMTADDGYQFFLDGRALGQGANWHGLTEYDLARLLTPGPHVLAVNCFNDLYLAGLIMGLQIQLSDGKTLDIQSDASWRVVPKETSGWESLLRPRAGWPAATVVSGINRASPLAGGHWPDDYMKVPPFDPVLIPFWQTGWFHLLAAIVSGMVFLACIVLYLQLALRAKEQRLLDSERSRIARDIHDDFGTRLTRLVLESEVAQNETAEAEKSRQRLSRIGDGLRDALEVMDEVLWAVNPRRDTVSDFVTFICEHAQNYLQPAGIECVLDVEPDMPPLDFDLPLRRSLLLAVKEAIANVAKHSGATKLLLKIHRQNSGLAVVVQDNGKGFSPAQSRGQRNGIGNMIQRMREVGGRCEVNSAPGKGCSVEFNLPLTRRQRLGWLNPR